MSSRSVGERRRASERRLRCGPFGRVPRSASAGMGPRNARIGVDSERRKHIWRWAGAVRAGWAPEARPISVNHAMAGRTGPRPTDSRPICRRPDWNGALSCVLIGNRSDQGAHPLVTVFDHAGQGHRYHHRKRQTHAGLHLGLTANEVRLKTIATVETGVDPLQRRAPGKAPSPGR